MGAVRLASRFSIVVKHYREQAGVSQEQLAERMGVSVGTVRHWEQVGVTTLPPQRIRELAGLISAPAHEIASAMGYPVVSNGADADGSGLPPLNPLDRAKVLEYANLLFQQERAEESQPPGRRRAGGGSDAA